MDLGPPASDTPRLIGLQARRTLWGLPGDPFGGAHRVAHDAAHLRESETPPGGAWGNYGPPLAQGGPGTERKGGWGTPSTASTR